MTEQEWLNGDELWRMLKHALAGGLFSARKQILFCAAACRLPGAPTPADYLPILDDLEVLADEPGLPALPPGKLLDDLEVRAERLEDLRRRAGEVFGRRCSILAPGEYVVEGDPRFEADEPVMYAVLGDPFASCRGDKNGSILHSPEEAGLLRELLGNPFRPKPIVEPGWLGWNGGVVRRLANAAYDERRPPCGRLDPQRLAVLGDALEEAGCSDAGLLGHCRGPARHVRGCWLLDLLTGKS